MSSISLGFITIFGIVECGVCRNACNEILVTDGSAAIAENVGAFGSADAALGRTPWHCEHHRWDNTRPFVASALASPGEASQTKSMPISATYIVFGIFSNPRSMRIAYRLHRRAYVASPR